MRIEGLKSSIGALLLAIALIGGVEAQPVEAGSDPVLIRHPVVGQLTSATHSPYFMQVLELALERAGIEYQFEGVLLSEFYESRSTFSLGQGLYDVHWMHTSKEREEALIPIRIPLLRGLIGWRLLGMKAGDQPRFNDVTEVGDLEAFTLVQGHDWPDTDVLSRAGLNVWRAPSKEGMFRMLAAGRVDLFPRAITEIWQEMELFSDLDVAVEENLVLVYPSAYYFFVTPEKPELAEAIEKGLNKAVEDGSFEEAFQGYFGEVVERSGLADRKILRIDNPLMPEHTPLDRPELWYQP